MTTIFGYANNRNSQQNSMKKSLPIFKNTSGFTLIELMVVIAIIGILAVVALGIFSGAQGSARDSRRVAEIDSLAKNIESTRDPGTGNYQYTSAIMLRDYPNGLADPGGTTPAISYCQAAATTNANLPAVPTPWNTGTGACPTNYPAIGGVAGTPNSTVGTTAGNNNDVADGNTGGTATRAWRVCATLERSNTVFCRTNVIQ